MKKHCFYHIYCKNSFIEIHNSIFAKIISNPFFDDAQFYFSVISDDDEWNKRLIMPVKAPIIKKYKNTNSEAPCALLMKEHVDNISDDDVVLYFHCKGSSKTGSETSKIQQDNLLSKYAIRIWVDCVLFFMIERIEDYIHYCQQYGSLCTHQVRHLFGNGYKSGTIGNFWWCRGDILKNIKSIENIEYKNRHYFEISFLGELLSLSSNVYKFSYYIHDGDLGTYDLDSIGLRKVINGYINRKYVDIINIEKPLDYKSPAVVILSNDIHNKFKIAQRFKNYIIHSTNQPPPPALIYIDMKDGQLNVEYPSDWLDNILRKVYTNPIKSSDIMVDGFKITLGEK